MGALSNTAASTGAESDRRNQAGMGAGGGSPAGLHELAPRPLT